jgi:hypothetical protein
MSFAQHLLHRVASAPWPTVDLGDRKTLVDNLEYMLQLMVASEPLVDLAARQADRAGAIRLRDYYLAHADEERGHAAWLDEDLTSVGIHPQGRMLCTSAAELAGSQYYLLMHAHPAAFLGYTAVLECFPLPMSRVDDLEAVHGVSLMRTLRYHAQHDVDHGADLCAELDALPENLHDLVVGNAMNTTRHLINAAQRFGKG